MVFLLRRKAVGLVRSAPENRCACVVNANYKQARLLYLSNRKAEIPDHHTIERAKLSNVLGEVHSEMVSQLWNARNRPSDSRITTTKGEIE
jgi:hypothetical protein